MKRAERRQHDRVRDRRRQLDAQRPARTQRGAANAGFEFVDVRRDAHTAPVVRVAFGRRPQRARGAHQQRHAERRFGSCTVRVAVAREMPSACAARVKLFISTMRVKMRIARIGLSTGHPCMFAACRGALARRACVSRTPRRRRGSVASAVRRRGAARRFVEQPLRQRERVVAGGCRVQRIAPYLLERTRECVERHAPRCVGRSRSSRGSTHATARGWPCSTSRAACATRDRPRRDRRRTARRRSEERTVRDAPATRRLGDQAGGVGVRRTGVTQPDKREFSRDDLHVGLQMRTILILWIEACGVIYRPGQPLAQSGQSRTRGGTAFVVQRCRSVRNCVGDLPVALRNIVTKLLALS